MAKKNPKRFYKTVSLKQVEDHYHILLDERVLKTPGKKTLIVPAEPLAAAVVAEWDAQSDHIIPANMPLTRLLNVAIEQTPENRTDLLTEARRYAGTDLLCYRAPEPRLLIERQNEIWTPWVDWAASQGVALEVTSSLVAIEQPHESLDAVEAFAATLDDISLTLFVHLIAVYGSVILAMAVMERKIAASEAFDVSRLDVLYQIELWGEDEQAADITKALRTETHQLGEILGMI